MITCPHCSHQEMEGAFFCSHCGAELLAGNGTPTSDIAQGSGDAIQQGSFEKAAASRASHPQKIQKIILRINNDEKVIPIHADTEITLGRVSTG